MSAGVTPDRPAPPPYRVVQWATGTIGARSLRAVVEHPDLELVGVVVHAAAKEGLDAGALCGLPEVGITATRDVDEVLAAAPHCVLYMPQGGDPEELCRLLAAGVDVVTTVGRFHHPASMDPALRARVEDACAAGGTSLHATGSSPGFISEAVPLALLSVQRRLERLDIDEFADLSQRPSPELLFDLMGFGRDPNAVDGRRWAHGAASFGPSLRLVAEAVRLPLDDVTGDGAVACARRHTTIAAGTIPAGTVAAQRMTVTGLRRGRPLVRFRATWYCTADLDPAWDLQATGWRLRVDGDAPLDVALRLDVPIERMAELAPGFTAHRAVNAVPALWAAPPGIRTTVDLPHPVSALAG